MMTEEQLIGRICLTCVDVRHAATDESAQKFINDIRGLAEQLAVLTQPASPALKLPDEKPRREGSNDTALSQVYELGIADGFNRCLREVAKLNAPNTAPIEPICATGGAEWTDKQCMEFLTIAFRHMDISGDILMDDIRLGVKMATQQVRN